MDYVGQAGQDIGAARAAGYFSPQGSPAVLAATKRAALRTADNSRRRNAILARLMGLDPAQAAVAAVNADTSASTDTANALNDAQYNQLSSAQQFARGLYGGQLANQNQRDLLKYQYDLNKPSIGGMVGSALGTAAGAYLGGAGGAAAGGQVGGALGGKRSKVQYDPYYSNPQTSSGDQGTFNGYDPYR
jgi:hypothetical protein